MSRNRRLALALPALILSAVSLRAATWPESLPPYHRVADQPLSVTANSAIWNEYGFRDAETAHYAGDTDKFTATAYRFQDSTGAMAAFDWLRPSDAKPSPVAHLAVENASGSLVAQGNYVLKFQGYHPTGPFLTTVVNSLKQVDGSPLPTLLDYMPNRNLVPNSERYILGPAGLAQFDPGVPPSAAAFRLGAEAELARFKAPGGDMTLALFSYPTPQIARQQNDEFGKLPGAVVKRSGPLVAVILAPPNRDDAERLLSQIRYQADVTLDERVNTRRDNIGDLVINAFILIGILLTFSLVGGLAVGGLRLFMRRGGKGEEADALTVLHLHDRPAPLERP